MRMNLTLALAVSSLVVVGTACSSASAAPEVPGASPTAPTQVGGESIGNVRITGVRAFIRDGKPQAFVDGEIGDGCNSLQGINEKRTKNQFDISVTFRRQGDLCTMQMQLLNQWVPLSGTFEPGEYTLQVNDTKQTFKLVSSASGLRVDPDPGPLPRPPYGPSLTGDPSGLPTR
jgi:hypothetical protein